MTLAQNLVIQSGTAFGATFLHAITGNQTYTFQDASGTVAFLADITGGNTLGQAYNEGGSGVGRTVLADNGEVVITIDGGPLPSTNVRVALVLANTSAAGDDVELSLISGTSGLCTINFGDTANEDQGFLEWLNGSNTFTLNAGSDIFTASVAAGIEFNPSGVTGLDFTVRGDTIARQLFVKADASLANIAFFAGTEPNWRNMDRGIHFGEVTTIPTDDPINGAFLYVLSPNQFTVRADGVHVLQAAVGSAGEPTAFLVTTGGHVGLTAVEFNAIHFDLSSPAEFSTGDERSPASFGLRRLRLRTCSSSRIQLALIC